jgi:uncharacterized phage-associated protein
MTFSGVSAAVVQLLVAARSDGVHVNRTKLAKLLYLADLQAVDQGLPPGTEVEWRWRHHGPYSNALLEVEQDLELAGVVQVVETSNYYGTPERRLRLLAEAPQVHIDEQFHALIDTVVARYGRWSATQLKDLTYQTPPMEAAQRQGKKEVRLDLAGGDPFPDLEPALARLRRVARELPPLEDDAGATEELEEELEEWSLFRREATGHMLDGE